MNLVSEPSIVATPPPRDIDILFVFPHPDDEFGALSALSYHKKKGDRILCVFVTSTPNMAPLRANESHRVFRRLGLDATSLLFLGDELKVPDGTPWLQQSRLVDWFDNFFKSNPELSAAYIPAFEGGHQDHDFIHALVVLSAARHNQISKIHQVPLYTGCGLPWLFFSVEKALRNNGPVHLLFPSTFLTRMWQLSLIFEYRSQWTTWLALFPVLAVRRMHRRRQQIQSVSVERVFERPHEGPLLYERRGTCSWDRVHTQIRSLTSN